MKSKKNNNSKALQNFTFSELLKKEIITKDDLNSFSDEEQTEIFQTISKLYNEAKGKEKDKIYLQASEIIAPETKNSIWEVNHNQIICFIHNGIIQNNKMPTIIDLVEKTGLSRQTITKHLKEFKENDLYKEHKAQFQILATSVLKKLFDLSMNGSVQACKIFLDAIGETNQSIKANQYIDKQQNNYNAEPVENLTIEQRLQRLNLTENELIDYLEKINSKLEKDY